MNGYGLADKVSYLYLLDNLILDKTWLEFDDFQRHLTKSPAVLSLIELTRDSETGELKSAEVIVKLGMCPIVKPPSIVIPPPICIGTAILFFLYIVRCQISILRH